MSDLSQTERIHRKIEIGEAWLAQWAQQAEPVLPAGLLERVKRRVRRELALQQAASVSRRAEVALRPWWARPAWGAAAAAAMLAIAVGLITLQPPGRAILQTSTERTVSEFVSTLAIVLEDRDPELVNIRTAVELLERQVLLGGTSTRPAEAGLWELLDALEPAAGPGQQPSGAS